ncbi:FAD-dependent monooxygenase [Paracoccus sanguinis]|uniref:Phenol 2-monooxygenase n=1 Tax=Paracoccus sanguinis TaxID=1545044 RepID=A0A1H3BX17_9RHOB|nr:FAD-dependent monooxygenase [Paracoccus sanguinis]KGJ16897.1 phenol 2-monooxygenase [Paracoccus sanguinis]SDX46482.1 phenol 2-monooxygenase [Paracoccus sanguinis]
MQYHRDGFRPGDPRVHPAAPGVPEGGTPLPDRMDVLIVGSGPAGLTLAAQLSAFPEITTRVVERRDGPLEKGQADGISCRSMEMFQAFGFAHTVKEQGYWVNEATFWKADPADPARLVRAGRVQDVEDGLSEMPHVILNQARVHDFYLEIMRHSPSRLSPDYGLTLVGLTVEEGAEHPVVAELEAADGTRRTVRARYAVGCEGARSAVRRAIGRELRGDSANQAWGVMDVLCDTDFPDIRMKSILKSDRGSVLIIPREGGFLTRIYIELDKLAAGERVADRANTLDRLVAAAQAVFAPFTLTVRDVAWWSVYEIGQRLTDRFDDVPEGADRLPRVFIAGDACHTHSPKAGQGMNVSMGDGFNLGWKLAAVLRGRADPAILHSYSAERQGVAQDLIDFDRRWARIMSERPEDGADTPQFQRSFIENGRYTAGMQVTYALSALIGPATHQHLATGFPVGARLHSAPVVRLADALPMHLGHAFTADGRWRLIAFAPDEDHAAEGAALNRLCGFLADDPASPLRHNRPGEDADAQIDLRAVLPQGFRDVALETLPALLRPRVGRLGLVDAEKIFCADPSRDIYALRGIDRAQGALVVVRPDQHVAHVLPLDATDELAAFFDGFLI